MPPEEPQARNRRYWLAGGFGLAALGVVLVYFSAAPTARYIRAWQSRRAADAAFALVDSGRLNEASAKARDAYHLAVTEPEAWRAIAHLLTIANRKRDAFVWWKKVEEAKRLTRQDRREYAEAALAAARFSVATAQVEYLLADPAFREPVDLLLAAQVAIRKGNYASALELSQQTLADPKSGPHQRFEAATAGLSVTRPDTSNYRKNWDLIQQWAQDLSNPISLEALTLIAKQPPTFAQVARLELAKLLEEHPKARPFHRLLALDLRILEEPGRREKYVAEAIAAYGAGDDESVLALCRWLYGHHQFELVLRVLSLDRALTNRELFVQHVDALAASGRIVEAADLLSNERFPLEPTVRHMYLAVSRSRLEESTGAANEWERALESADSPATALALGDYAEKHRAEQIADRAYAVAIRYEPENREAYEARLRLAKTVGNTLKMQALINEMVGIWPEDTLLRNEQAYLRLLLGCSQSDAEELEKHGEHLFATEPENWSIRATIALARLRLSRGSQALSILTPSLQDGPVPPYVSALRAAALLATGATDKARDEASALANSSLLPEERSLITPALSTSK